MTARRAIATADSTGLAAAYPKSRKNIEVGAAAKSALIRT